MVNRESDAAAINGKPLRHFACISDVDYWGTFCAPHNNHMLSPLVIASYRSSYLPQSYRSLPCTRWIEAVADTSAVLLGWYTLYMFEYLGSHQRLMRQPGSSQLLRTDAIAMQIRRTSDCGLETDAVTFMRIGLHMPNQHNLEQDL